MSYKKLCQRLTELGRGMLPASPSPTGIYTDSEYDQTRGYILLAHAEIEHYLETQADSAAKKIVDDWIRRQIVTPALFCLYTISYDRWASIDPTFAGKLTKLPNCWDVEKRVIAARDQYLRAISDNNGIREDNLKKLFIPLGIRLGTDCDSKWLADIDSFGSLRGQIAHMSGKMYQDPNPSDLKKLLWTSIIPGCKKLESTIHQRITAGAPWPVIPTKKRWFDHFFR